MNVNDYLPRAKEIQNWLSNQSVISSYRIDKIADDNWICYIGSVCKFIFRSASASNREEALQLASIEFALALGWKE